MNAVLLALPGLAAGLAIALAVAAYLPALPSLGDAIDNLSGSRSAVSSEWPLTRRERIGSRVRNSTHWAPHILAERDREVVGITTAELHYRKMLGALAGALLPIAIGLLQQLAGAGSLLLPAAASIVGLAIGWLVPDWLLRARARRVRGEYQRLVAVYLELVGAAIHRGLPAATALGEAASIANTPTLRRIRRALSQAALNHDKPWEALADLATTLDVPELGEVSRIVSLSGDRGGSIYETLIGRGRSLRNDMLAKIRSREGKRSENLTLPLVLTGGIVIAILVAPMLVNIGDLSGLSVSP